MWGWWGQPSSPGGGTWGCRLQGEPCPQDPSKGAQDGAGWGLLRPEERSWQHPGAQESFMEQSFVFSPPLPEQPQSSGTCRGPVAPNPEIPHCPPPAPTLRHPPASFLRNPDSSKVCHAAESPGLGPLGAPALQTGGVGWGDRLTGQSRICQGCPPHAAGTHVKYSISTHLRALEGCVSETESLIWPVLSTCQCQALGVRNEGDLFL